MNSKCEAKVEVYSRVCGFFRPVQQWNRGKKEEYRDRAEYVVAPDKTRE
jgi:ribonucleoside-triphosphate reductase